ncbi:MAG: acetyltransferase [Clostridiales Family XIII bacterium]|jgi:sugar O-acyltransferase (sialic acid O-acetyltransferase NeuD family)|nr:acetyltransferase [Clostridiales Family XIII bacterium]
MSKDLVIFGIGEQAQLAHWFFSHDTEYRAAAFAVDAAFIGAPSFCGLPVVPFETLAESFAPSAYDLFVAVGYSKVNRLRKEKYLAAKSMGYRCPSYISKQATVLNDMRFGENCFILEDNTIQPFAEIGDNVTLWSGNHIGHHAKIESHCFITSHVVVSGGVTVGESCFIGVNATLRDHIRIGERSVLGAGTLILSDTAPGSVYIGNATKPAELPSEGLRRI